MSESHADANFEEYDMPTGLGQIVKDGEVVETYNRSGIIPTEYKLLVLPDDVPEMTRGGLLVPVSIREGRQAAATTGTDIAIADEAFSFVQPKDAEGDVWPRVPVVGERVAFARYAGMAIQGKEPPVRGQSPRFYRLMNDKDVAAILDFPFDPETYQF
jgi:co-chaperonin GroES (HSP10)